MPAEQTLEPSAFSAEAMPGDDVGSTEIARRVEQHVTVMPVMSPGEIESYWRTANALARSRMFKDAYQAEQAFAKILIGRDLGISPTQSLMGIDLVEGSIQLRGVLLGQFLRKHPDYDYKILENTNEQARVQLLGFPMREPWDDTMVHFRGMFWEVVGEETFNDADAQRAGLVKERGNHAKYPKNMKVWRALSNAVKFHAPDVFAGMPVYVEGEIDPRSNPTDGTGSGHAAGITLPAEVEAVIARAEALGHQGYADRGTAEMAIGGQADAHVQEWVARATAELDKLGGEPVDAEVVPDEPEPSSEVAKPEPADETGADMAALELRADRLREQIADAETRGDEEALADLSAELDLVAEKIAGANANQGQLL